MFHVIQDAYCIVRQRNGVHKQAKVYQYNNGLYVGVKGGYVRLMKDGNVGTPDMSWIELVTHDIKRTQDAMGRLVIEN